MVETVPIDVIIVADRCRKDLGDIAALARSIGEVGLLHHPVITRDYRLVAGERRIAALKSLGWVEIPCTVADTLTDAAALLKAERDENTERKALAPSEVVAVADRIADALRPEAEARRAATLKQNAAVQETYLNGPQPQIRDVAAAAAGTSGRTYQKAKAVVEAAQADPEKFGQIADEMDRTGKVDGAFNRLKAEKQRETDAERAAALAPTSDRYKLHTASIADMLGILDPRSIDAIITDPPYPKEYLNTYDDLGRLSAYALKPGGSLLVMVGQAHLPEVIRRIGESLRYHWTLAYMMGGATAKMFGLKVIVGWKPVLWFVNGPSWEPPSGEFPLDVATSDGRDKTHHHWGQSESGMADLIEKVSAVGDTVLDPFVGGGSTGIAALRLGRSFIGSDIDADAVNRTLVRLAEVE